MRRGLRPEELGDLFDRPIALVVSLSTKEGTILARPVWHRWEDGRFVLQFPDGDRKIAMVERDPRITVLLAEDEFPYRGIEVRGRARMTRAGYHERAAAICRRYVDAFDPKATIESYLSVEPGMIVEVDADVTNAWDYADDAMMPI